MRVLREIGKIKLKDNWDSNRILKLLKDHGFEIRVIPVDKNWFEYGILVEEEDERITE